MKKSILFALALLVSCTALWAESQRVVAGLDVQAERGRIQAERKAIEARSTTEQTACYQKFAVNDCIGASRAVRRTALADLRRQEVALNDAERKRKGTLQIQRMEQRESADTQEKEAKRRERSKTQTVTREATAERKQHEAVTPKTPRSPRDPAAGRKSPAAVEAAAAEERDRFRRKQEEAAAHRAQTIQRQAERKKPLAKPLPEPQ